MSQDVFKPKGKVKKYEAGAGKQNAADVPIIATVMNNIDPTNSGRIEVYPSESLDKAGYDKSTWIPVRKLSAFFGSVKPQAGDDNLGDYVSNPSSYGQWNAPPDIGTKVVCIFINGDMNYGFYIGAVADGSELQMIPAIGSSDRVIANEGEAQSYGGATTLPVTNINTNNPDVSDNPDYLQAARPIHSYSATIMHQQGILRDRIRGPISSSASRESSSRVGWGVSTPGRPIYNGGYTDETLPSNLSADPTSLKVVARRGGHSIVMDDGDIIGRDQLIRIRTALGHQILMSDDGQTLMLLHSNGQSYIELGKEGTVDVFATNSINLRTQGDLNLHADNMVNIHAGKDININATENINVNSDKKFMQRVGENYELYSLKDLLFKSDTNIALDAASKSSVKSGGESYYEGSKIHLNDGSAGVTPVKIEPIPIVKHTDTLFDEQTGWSAAPGKLDSITSRAPAHCPWLGAGQGVDVTVNSSADAALPPSPPSNVSNLNAQALTRFGQPGTVSDATVASVPEVSAISKSFDKNATTSMLGGVATQAAQSFGKNSITKGTAKFFDTTTGKVAASVGAFAQTPSQLASGGILKPGADNMVNALVASGKTTIEQAMPQSIFTGKDGVNNLNSLTSSVNAQAKSVVTNMQKAQTGLTLAGAITGKEAAGGIGGIVAAAAGGTSSARTLGQQVSSTVNLVKNGLGGGGDPFSVSGAIRESTLTSIKQGASAAIASTLTGGLGGITKSLNVMDKSNIFLGSKTLDNNIGPVASAFKTITKTFKPFPANKPIDLTNIAKGISAEIISDVISDEASTISDTLGSIGARTVGAGAIEGALDSATSAVTGAVKDVVGGITSDLIADAVGKSGDTLDALGKSAVALTQQNQLTNAAQQVQRGLSAGAASAAATGLKDLPGGTAIAGAIVNSAKGSLNPISDNLTGLTGQIENLAKNAFSGLPAIPNLPGQGSLSGITSALASGLPAGAQAAVQSALASLTSGGGSTVKLPTIGINTFDRSSITSAIDNVLGPAIIPRPNLLGEISPALLGIASSLLKQRKDLATAARKLSTANKKAIAAQSAYSEVLANSPAGSPEIASALAAYETSVAELDSARTAVETILATAPKAVKEKVPAGATTLEETKQAFQDLETTIQDAARSDNTLALLATRQTPGSNLEQFRVDNNSDVFAPATGSEQYYLNPLTGESFRFSRFSNALSSTSGFENHQQYVPPPPPPDLVDESDEPVEENTIGAVVGPIPPPNPPPPPPPPPQSGGGCVVLDSYIPAVESSLWNGRAIEKAWQLREGYNISLGKDNEDLEVYLGKVVFNHVDHQPCVRLVTKTGVSLVCSTTAPIFTKDLEFVNAPDLMNKEVACMKNDETFWDEVVSIEDMGHMFVAVINAGDTAFWAGETNEAFILHHNISKDSDLSSWKKK